MKSPRPVVKANEIRLKRSQNGGPFLVVEGRDDRLFMEGFTCPSTCKIEVAQGKQNVCEVIKILYDDSFLGALGMIDADFDRIEGLQEKSSNIFMPECHDLETMLICSPALDRVLVEFCSQSKLNNFGENVLEALLNRALPAGYLRLHSIRNGLGLKFDSLNYSSWIAPDSFEPSTARLINEVLNRSQRQDLSPDLLNVAIQELEDPNHDPREICNGTDLVEILAIGLRNKLGSNSTTTVRSENLRRSLRLAYSDEDFRMSSLGKDIQDWETRVKGFRVLRR